MIKINKETHRISLGMKQLQEDPWDLVAGKYPLSSTHTGRVTNITDYGAFVELEAGVEGLVHVSEMSWTKKNVHPGKIVSTSQEVDVEVLDVDSDKRRISLGCSAASIWARASLIDACSLGRVQMRSRLDFDSRMICALGKSCCSRGLSCFSTRT